MRRATQIVLTSEERDTLERWTRAPTTERRYVERARYILAASEGEGTTAIARRFGVRPATVSKWRTRFAEERSVGLQDAPRAGPKVQYGKEVERQILSKLDDPPPKGYATWNGRLLAQALDVPDHHVWRVLRKYGIQLQRRRSWCESTDPEFARKAADVIGLYLDPPDNAVVLCVDEKRSSPDLCVKAERKLLDASVTLPWRPPSARGVTGPDTDGWPRPRWSSGRPR